MSLTNPIIKSKTDLICDIQAIMGHNEISEAALIASLNQAIGSWGNRVQYCVCIGLEDYECGRCEYDAGCCQGIEDIVPQIKPYTCGCDTGCWQDLCWWKVECGKLITSGAETGQARAIAYINNTQIPTQPMELIRLESNQLWIKGRIPNLPPAGYIKVCDEWVSYQCYHYSEMPQPGTIDITPPETGSIDPDVGFDVSVGIDETDTIDGSDCIPGVHTVLDVIERDCREVMTRDVFLSGIEVELGIVAADTSAFDILMNQALSNSYRTQMNDCASDKQRETAWRMMRFYLDMEDRKWRNFTPSRQPRTKLKSREPQHKTVNMRSNYRCCNTNYGYSYR